MVIIRQLHSSAFPIDYLAHNIKQLGDYSKCIEAVRHFEGRRFIIRNLVITIISFLTSFK